MRKRLAGGRTLDSPEGEEKTSCMRVSTPRSSQRSDCGVRERGPRLRARRPGIDGGHPEVVDAQGNRYEIVIIMELRACTPQSQLAQQYSSVRPSVGLLLRAAT